MLFVTVRRFDVIVGRFVRLGRFGITVGFGAGLKFVVVSSWLGLESPCLVVEGSGCLGENPVLAFRFLPLKDHYDGQDHYHDV